jgi:hypothetical protein
MRFAVVRRHLSLERLTAERARVSHDISNIAKGIEDMLALVAARQITSDQADCVVAQCREEHRMLGDRLELLDAAIAGGTRTRHLHRRWCRSCSCNRSDHAIRTPAVPLVALALRLVAEFADACACA